MLRLDLFFGGVRVTQGFYNDCKGSEHRSPNCPISANNLRSISLVVYVAFSWSTRIHDVPRKAQYSLLVQRLPKKQQAS